MEESRRAIVALGRVTNRIDRSSVFWQSQLFPVCEFFLADGYPEYFSGFSFSKPKIIPTDVTFPISYIHTFQQHANLTRSRILIIVFSGRWPGM
jgi:hypothetical protein